jgi:hypothetical protein
MSLKLLGKGNSRILSGPLFSQQIKRLKGLGSSPVSQAPGRPRGVDPELSGASSSELLRS